MRQSNLYIVLFTLATTVFVGGALAIASILLKPEQEKSMEWDKKSQILSSVIDLDENADVLTIYDQHIVGLVVNSKGEEVKTDDKGPIVAEKVNILANYKRPAGERILPIFKYVKDSAQPNEVEAYVLPIYGNGLWDRIWGFVALDSDLETIRGISFGHKQETPGLGARISDDPIVRERFKGKKIYDKNGQLVSITMVKGEKGLPLDDNHVDGMSGASMTAKGVNRMLKDYLECYKQYFERTRREQKMQSDTLAKALPYDSLSAKAQLDSVSVNQ